LTALEIYIKRDFKKKVEAILKDQGGTMKLTRLVKTLRDEGYHSGEILKILDGVGIHTDTLTDVASLDQTRPMQTSLDALIL